MRGGFSTESSWVLTTNFRNASSRGYPMDTGDTVFASGNSGSPRVILLDFGVPMTQEILNSPRGRPGPPGNFFEFFPFFFLFLDQRRATDGTVIDDTDF